VSSVRLDSRVYSNVVVSSVLVISLSVVTSMRCPVSSRPTKCSPRASSVMTWFCIHWRPGTNGSQRPSWRHPVSSPCQSLPPCAAQSRRVPRSAAPEPRAPLRAPGSPRNGAGGAPGSLPIMGIGESQSQASRWSKEFRSLSRTRSLFGHSGMRRLDIYPVLRTDLVPE
jgi:hypothetical protein